MRNIGFGLTDNLCEVLLRATTHLDQPPIALGLLDRREIFTLQVLDERDLGRPVSGPPGATMTGISCNQARGAARHRRSPAISSNASPRGRTSTGCSTPFSRIEAASSPISASGN